MAALANARAVQPSPAAAPASVRASQSRGVASSTDSTTGGPFPSARLAGSGDSSTCTGHGGAMRGPKLCTSCSQRRRSVLLLPCKHMLLCDACADVESCPSCGMPCKQRIKLHWMQSCLAAVAAAAAGVWQQEVRMQSSQRSRPFKVIGLQAAAT
jgi:hypothetical protein